MPFDATSVSIDSTGLLSRLTAGEDAPGLAAIKILVAQFGNRRSLARRSFRSRRIAALSHLTEDAASLVSSPTADGHPPCDI
jgi:hypothetical protein